MADGALNFSDGTDDEHGPEGDSVRVTDYEWIWIWSWHFWAMEGRIEINPLSWYLGFMLGPLGARIDIGCVGLGLAWGPQQRSEEAEQELLRYLKRKYRE